MEAARPHDVIVIGASAGGVPALKEVVHGLGSDFPAAILIVLHVSASTPSSLPAILGRETSMDVHHAAEGEAIAPGTVLVAPPDLQMTVVDGVVRLARGPRENGHRPAIDPLMRSAADALGPRVVGVVLSGMLSDGTVGLAAIKAAGGVTVVQDPGTAAFAAMPTSAIAGVGPDHVVSLRDLPALLRRVVERERNGKEHAVAEEHRPERTPVEVGDDNPGHLTAFTCPECHGTLWESERNGVPSFRCRVGHRYTVDALVAAQAHGAESALWAAARALEEKASLHRRVAARLRSSGHEASALGFDRSAEAAEVQAAQVTLLLEGVEGQPEPVPVDAG